MAASSDGAGRSSSGGQGSGEGVKKVGGMARLLDERKESEVGSERDE